MIENTISIESTSADNNNYTDMLGETEVHNFSMDQNEEKSAETDDIYTETDTLKDSAEASAANPQEETVELTVYGEKVTVPLSQALAQAQKGIAFERMKEQLNQAKNDLRLKTLERLEQQTGKNAYQLLGDMQHQAISDSFIARYGSFDNVPFEELRQAVKSLEESRMRLEENRMENSYSNWSSQLEEFMNAHPGCNEIPDEVIEAARKGENITLAYNRIYSDKLTNDIQAAKRELEVLENENRAAKNATPSAKSTGAESKPRQNEILNFMKSTW